MSGRFFAEEELMAGVSVVLRAFEIELLDQVEHPEFSQTWLTFLWELFPPKGKVGFRIRRRKLQA